MSGSSEPALSRARAGDESAFGELTGPYRRELQLHCYRMLGSLHDAEDALQETLVAAWRSLDQLERQESMRAWLYRIATNRCLNVLRAGARRPRSDAGPLRFEPPPATRMSELTYLEPYPDALLEGISDAAPGPEARYEMREAVGLAFIAALQRLPERQRAVLVLRDALGFRAAEVAELLQVSEAVVNSALVRARVAVAERMPAGVERLPVPASARERELALAFADAFAEGDLDRVVSMLSDDAWVRMPPEPFEYQGTAAITEFFEHVGLRRQAGGRTRLLETRANGQLAFGHYVEEVPGCGVAVGRGLFVLTLRDGRVCDFTRFGGSDLLERCALPERVGLRDR
ncbi:MAG TPA: RNA polymerase subunit sigma-70 [Solirubrobacteraceae bacterium]|nr:RNA polymerase subunit sigma-70 [Solirubrobacteraceae bacterium]